MKHHLRISNHAYHRLMIAVILGLRWSFEFGFWRFPPGNCFSPVAAGIVAGIIGSVWLSQLVASQLFQTAPNDPEVISVTSLLLAAVALLACWLPARRAARTDPLIALRSE